MLRVALTLVLAISPILASHCDRMRGAMLIPSTPAPSSQSQRERPQTLNLASIRQQYAPSDEPARPKIRRNAFLSPCRVKRVVHEWINPIDSGQIYLSAFSSRSPPSSS